MAREYAAFNDLQLCAPPGDSGGVGSDDSGACGNLEQLEGRRVRIQNPTTSLSSGSPLVLSNGGTKRGSTVMQNQREQLSVQPRQLDGSNTKVEKEKNRKKKNRHREKRNVAAGVQRALAKKRDRRRRKERPDPNNATIEDIVWRMKPAGGRRLQTIREERDDEVSDDIETREVKSTSNGMTASTNTGAAAVPFWGPETAMLTENLIDDAIVEFNSKRLEISVTAQLLAALDGDGVDLDTNDLEMDIYDDDGCRRNGTGGISGSCSNSDEENEDIRYDSYKYDGTSKDCDFDKNDADADDDDNYDADGGSSDDDGAVSTDAEECPSSPPTDTPTSSTFPSPFRDGWGDCSIAIENLPEAPLITTTLVYESVV